MQFRPVGAGRYGLYIEGMNTSTTPVSSIQRSRNSVLLRELYRLMGTDATDLEPYKLTKEQQASVNRGNKEVKAGRTLTEREANKAVLY